MILEGQGATDAHPGGRERGYAMAALLVGLSVMAVLMGVMMPVWVHQVQREKEEEFIFRAQQYARAIGLFQKKYANTAPPTIDLLVEQRFLRKKYKDPITNDDFQPIYANQATPGGNNPPPTQGKPGPGAPGGIIGVTSKSKESSIKTLNGRTKYNEWVVVYVQTAQRPTGPGAQTPGQQQGPGQQGQGPGQTSSPFGTPPMPGSSMPGMPGVQGGQPGQGRGLRPDLPSTIFPPAQPPGAPRRPGQ